MKPKPENPVYKITKYETESNTNKENKTQNLSNVTLLSQYIYSIKISI